MNAERAYRAALRWYPAGWRRDNGDVLIGTLMDAADAEGRTVPTRDELRDLRRSGLRTRAEEVLPGPVRDRVAGLAAGAGIAFALVLLTAQLWAPWDAASSDPNALPPDGLVWQVLVQPGLLLLGGLLAIAGWTLASRIVLIATLPALVIPYLFPDVPWELHPAIATLVMLGALAVMACLGRPARPRLFVSAGVTLAGSALWFALARPFGERYFPRSGLIDLIAGPWPVVLLVVVMLVFAVWRHRWSAMAVLVFSVPWLVLRTFDALWMSMPGGRSLAPLALVVIPVLVIVIIAVSRRRRAPAPPVR
jgi:hypothetical protein